MASHLILEQTTNFPRKCVKVTDEIIFTAEQASDVFSTICLDCAWIFHVKQFKIFIKVQL